MPIRPSPVRTQANSVRSAAKNTRGSLSDIVQLFLAFLFFAPRCKSTTGTIPVSRRTGESEPELHEPRRVFQHLGARFVNMLAASPRPRLAESDGSRQRSRYAGHDRALVPASEPDAAPTGAARCFPQGNG